MTSNEYEKLTSDIVAKFQLHKKHHNIFVKSGKNNKWRGASTHNHQIDVSLECDDTIYVIECKKYKKRINIADVLVLVGRIVDIQANEKRKIKGVFFTIKGYQKGAEKIADHFKIALNTASSIDEFAVQFAGDVIIGTPSLKLESELPQPTVVTSNKPIQRT